MDSQAKRNFTRSLINAYNESNKEIEHAQLLQVIKTIDKYNGRVALQVVSNYTMLKPKTIAGLIKRHSYCFKCLVHSSKKHSFTSWDVMLELTDDGKKMV